MLGVNIFGRVLKLRVCVGDDLLRALVKLIVVDVIAGNLGLNDSGKRAGVQCFQGVQFHTPLAEFRFEPSPPAICRLYRNAWQVVLGALLLGQSNMPQLQVDIQSIPLDHKLELASNPNRHPVALGVVIRNVEEAHLAAAIGHDPAHEFLTARLGHVAGAINHVQTMAARYAV